MPSEHDNNFAASGALALLACCGELIYFTPRNGTRRQIMAIVTRFPPERPNDVPRGAMPKIRIETLNDEADGVLLSGVNTGGDYFELEYLTGGGDEKFYITRLPKGPDGGMLRFEVF